MTSLQKRVDGDQRSMPLRDLTASTASPISTIAANLMPPEVIARRRLGWLKRRLAFALVALVALVGLGYGFVRQSTSSSRDELESTQAQTSTLQTRVAGFNNVLRLQGDAAQIKSRLATLMATDLQWSTLLANLSRVAPTGLVITAVNGELATVTAATGAQPGAYSDGSQPGVGTLEVSGKAKDYRSIAAYVDALGRIKGLTSVQPGSLGTEGGRSTFTVTIKVTNAALGGRFTPGGK